MSKQTESFQITIHNNADKIVDLLDYSVKRGLDAIGSSAVGHAQDNLTKFPRVDTGRLRGSITHVTTDDAVYIGTNVEYAPYVEFGTGIYASDGQGRKNPWVYTDEKGKTHWTRGMKPSHFLKKAITEHMEEYENLLKNSIENS